MRFKTIKAFGYFPALLIVLLAFPGGGRPALAAGVTVAVAPGEIDVGLDFRGQEVELTGTVPAGSDVFVKVVSPARNVNLTRKGRVGFLWMKVAQAEVEGIPKMYQIFSSRKINDLPAELQAKMGIDQNFQAVRDACKVKEISGNQLRLLSGEEGKEYLDALINMYQRDNLYAVRENTVQKSGNRFRVFVPLPASVAFGETLVSVYAVDVANGKILGEAKNNFTVRPVGLVGLERAMAKTNGPLYGILAIYIALAAGLVIDLLFNYLNKLFRLSKKTVPQN